LAHKFSSFFVLVVMSIFREWIESHMEDPTIREAQENERMERFFERRVERKFLWSHPVKPAFNDPLRVSFFKAQVVAAGEAGCKYRVSDGTRANSYLSMLRLVEKDLRGSEGQEQQE
jgi:hypothetical protein